MNCYIGKYIVIGRDYKVTDLCEFVGISRTAYYNILNGKSVPSLGVAFRIANYISKLVKFDVYAEDIWRE